MKKDWLIAPEGYPAEVNISSQQKEITVSNGLISRTWRVEPNVATVAFDNLMTGETIIRGVKPEAILTLNGQEHAVGGLVGQPDYAYLTQEWVEELATHPDAFQCTGYDIGIVKPRFPSQAGFFSKEQPWIASGVSLQLLFRSKLEVLQGLTVTVHYEMYDGIPLISKWVEIHNQGYGNIRLNAFISECLAVVEWDSPVETPERWEYPNLHVESDYAFQGMAQRKANRTTHWVTDPQYLTQVNYDRLTPAMLISRPPIGPNAVIESGERFETFRTFELIHDSMDRERKGLAQRKMYRLMAPWVQENPITLHVKSIEPQVVKAAIDQCAEVGFEMVILSFGSGLDMENEDPAYLTLMRELADYAHAKGIALGGYSLLASRSISKEHDVVNPHGAYYIHSPCLESKWGQEYFWKLQHFFEETGFDVLEHDGSYPGDICDSTAHPGHEGREDSQWRQWKRITDFYKWCRAKGIYLNVPDWYFLMGSNKAGMGYREVNWALPRERQIILSRQNIYDGTWEKAPSMGWMFVPLTSYQGGGPDSTLEPLSEHLGAYDAHLRNNFTAGVQAMYRGFRVYDTEETKRVVKRWVDFYKQYRDILESDVIHLRRPDGRGYDGLLHVNPRLLIKGLAVIHNPTNTEMVQTVELPIYYTGISQIAIVRDQQGTKYRCDVDQHHQIRVTLNIPAQDAVWLTITDNNG